MNISHSISLLLLFLLLGSTFPGQDSQAREKQQIRCLSGDTSLLCLTNAAESPVKPPFVPDLDPSLPELSYEDRLALISELIETDQMDEQLEKELNFVTFKKPVRNKTPLRTPASASFKSK